MSDYTPSKEVLDMASKALGVRGIVSYPDNNGFEFGGVDIHGTPQLIDTYHFGPGFAEFAAERLGHIAIMYWPADPKNPWSAIRANTHAYGPHIDAAVLELCAAIGRAMP